jgi:hypothetical protein
VENKGLIKYNDRLIKRVNNAVGITNKLLNVDLRNIYAIHLDDQTFYSEGLKREATHFFPNLKIVSFQEPKSALTHFEYCLKNNLKIDLIISDVQHSEPNGLIFSRMIRDIEKEYNKRVPILIISISIYSESLMPKIIEFLNDKTWDRVLHKFGQIKEIVEAIKELTM